MGDRASATVMESKAGNVRRRSMTLEDSKPDGGEVR